MTLDEITERVRRFEADAHKIFGVTETAKSRVVILNASYNQVSVLSIKQDDLLRQALRCLEADLFRAAHVMSWAACMDYLEEFAAEDGFNALKNARQKWDINSVTDLRERYAEAMIIDAMHDAKLLEKSEKKGFHGLLTRRNECAHPSDYYPGLNMSLGYVSEIIARLTTIQSRRN